jgi:putative drug exporter of the RND superfamily
VCFSLKSLFDSLDGIDQTADKIQGLQADTDHLASLTAQLAALIPPIIDTMKTTKALTLSLHSMFLAMLDQMGASNDTAW